MKVFFTTLGVLLVLVLLSIGLVLYVGFFLSPQNALEKSDAIVVISGGETRQRVEEAVKLFEEEYAPAVIMSGAARDEGPSNAEAMKRIAVNLGVPDDKILVEEDSTNTVANAKLVRAIIEENKLTKIILVTSPYHQRRAYIAFSKALSGLPVKIINHSSTDSVWRKNGWWQDDWAKAITISEIQKVLFTWVAPLEALE
ncbi:MAG: YdcF family protein [Patescibacteria group bacterium]|nr:YdcF family protein [Patescibacteria group bacterium]